MINHETVEVCRCFNIKGTAISHEVVTGGHINSTNLVIFDEDGEINEYDLTIFVKEKDELFRRFTETHFQRGYRLETMTELVKEAGMEFVWALDADTHGPVRENSERIYILAREKGK